MKNKKIFIFLTIFVMVATLLSCKEVRENDFAKIENDIEYFSNIDTVFETEHYIMDYVEALKEKGSGVFVYDGDTVSLFTITQFGIFSNDERNKVNIKNSITGLRMGYIQNPDKMMKELQEISIMLRVEDNGLKVAGWRFTIDKAKGDEIIKSIEKDFGIAGNVHDAFGWKSKNNRYLYTIYPKAIVFSIISEDFAVELMKQISDDSEEEVD